MCCGCLRFRILGLFRGLCAWDLRFWGYWVLGACGGDFRSLGFGVCKGVRLYLFSKFP